MPLPNPTLTLITHTDDIAGFQNKKMTITTRYNQSLEDIIFNINQYRGPKNQITKLFNSLGNELTSNAMKLKIKENTTLYIDTFTEHFKPNETKYEGYCYI